MNQPGVLVLGPGCEPAADDDADDAADDVVDDAADDVVDDAVDDVVVVSERRKR